MRLLIINLFVIVSSVSCFAQIASKDTANFKSDLKDLFTKYGIQLKGYSMNVVSVNQKGGQTAFVINNNYYGDAIADSENIYYEIRNEEQGKILYVAPKKGVWTSPFLMKDTSNHLPAFLNLQSVGVTSFLDTAPVLFDNRIHVVTAIIESQTRGFINPIRLKIFNEKNEFYIFGDFAVPTKHWIYKQGKIYPLDENAFHFFLQ